MAGSAALSEEIGRLGPWHIDIEVTPGVRTGAFSEATGESVSIPLYSPYRTLRSILGAMYPNGLQGRSALDCACNCGAFLFWAKELGAGDCYGFDVRDHWIKQARFLAKHRTVGPTAGLRFEVGDLYELPSRGLEPFDLTFFSGILYHLPEPITGLKITADLTTELMLVQTATMSGGPGDGYLAISDESREELLSGVYGLNWLPTGPRVVNRILKWSGFHETRTLQWEEESETTPGLGRLVVLASTQRSQAC